MSTFLLNAVLASPLAAQSNDVAPATPAAKPAQATHPTQRRVSLDDRVKTLATSLGLNEAQQAAVKKILEQRQQETLRLRRDASIPGSVRIERLRALQDQTVQRIRLVLNDEQKKKYDPLAVRQTGPAPGQKSVEDWLKVTTPQ
jgi:biopolymer transport protein ExbD